MAIYTFNLINHALTLSPDNVGLFPTKHSDAILLESISGSIVVASLLDGDQMLLDGDGCIFSLVFLSFSR
jgi:hypothetical protein